MALPKFKTTEQLEAAHRTRPRSMRESDNPIASPVHALQQRVHQNIAAVAPAERAQLSAMRIFLFVVLPLTMWTGIIKAASSLI